MLLALPIRLLLHACFASAHAPATPPPAADGGAPPAASARVQPADRPVTTVKQTSFTRADGTEETTTQRTTTTRGRDGKETARVVHTVKETRTPASLQIRVETQEQWKRRRDLDGTGK
jgi:hypothetical protein